MLARYSGANDEFNLSCNVLYLAKEIYMRWIPVSLLLLCAAASQAQQLTRVLSGPELPPLSEQVSKPAPDTVLQVAFSLKNIDSKGVDAFVSELYNPHSPYFHQWISTEQFGERFGASPIDVAMSEAFLRSQGFTNIHSSDTHLFVFGETTVANAEKAFHTNIGEFLRLPGLQREGDPPTFYAPTQPVLLPASLAATVSAVHGLDNFVLVHPGRHPNIGSGIIGSAYGPGDLAHAYDGYSIQHLYTDAGAGIKVAIFSPTKNYTGDTAVFCNYFGLGTPSVTYKVIDTGPTDYNGATEASLDIQTILGQAPKSSVLVFQPPNTGAGELDALSAVGASGAAVFSSSWGQEEHYLVAAGSAGLAFANSVNSAYQALAAAGISCFVATGDSGAYSRNLAGVITTQMESSTQYATGVGGSALFVDDSSNWLAEIAWSYNAMTNQGGTGGLSQIFSRPTWQNVAVNSYSNGKRQVPDVAANASPTTPYGIVYNGAWNAVDGTSAAAPLWAGTAVLMDYAFKAKAGTAYKPMGFINPAIYSLANYYDSANAYGNLFYMFHDITRGSNGVQPASVKWDFCTGWGTPEFYKIMCDLGFYNSVPTFAPNYLPYTPPGWVHPIVIHTSLGSPAEPSTFTHGVIYYLGFAMANKGNADGFACPATLSIDGVTVASLTFGALPPNGYALNMNEYPKVFTAGSHTLTVTVNPTHSLKESSTADNVYSRVITVL